MPPTQSSKALPGTLATLLDSRAYPHPVDTVVLIETHISWVLLAGEFAYKIKRPILYPFVDQRSLDRRRLLCHEELRLNRRLAAPIYLDVVEVRSGSGQARIGGDGEIIEYAVRMRRFDPEQQLDRLLERHDIEPRELEIFGQRLALFHAQAAVAGESEHWGTADQVRELVLKNWREAAEASAVLDARPAIAALGGSLEQRLDAGRNDLASRWQGGFVRECHGDLHTRNIARLQHELIAFDCAEFEPSFRWIDVADEMALLLVDLEARGAPGHAHAVWNGWLERSGDYPAHRILDLYKAHRALVRAKVAALSFSQSDSDRQRKALRAEHGRLIACAGKALRPRTPALLLMCGLSGSGKTWLARQVALGTGMVHVRSDVERKRLAGLEPGQHLSPGTPAKGLYAAQATARVYDHLLVCAKDVLCSGYQALIDATFMRRQQRQLFAALARSMGLRAIIVLCRSDPAVLRARLRSRTLSASDASDADESVLQWQLQNFEPFSADEDFDVIEADTSRHDIAAQVRSQLLGYKARIGQG